ncbi:MAG: hypothetical protein A2W99_17150 [Bacteroidetes bacterium GWF2_33_16]|nr:MAG: hypothetical protein A2X00_13645 [Bacteroidetes bacterium GWE2_32_14]OFY03474.1 MAG: hypothetical protein A2W99_17150 [Bacteroidetes bacterium GWF2_33_16]
MKKLLLLSFFVFITSVLSAQCIEGKVIDSNSNPIPYATIYCEETSKGTTSNIEGFFKLDLPKGEHVIIIRYLGYKTKELTIICSEEKQIVNIQLQEQAYKIPEVRILASGEDPAYSIMRKAIAMSYYYLNQVEEYNCRIYLKGSGKALEIPRILKKTLKKEGLEEGKPIVIENITDLHFKLPDIVEENTISMRSTMEGNDVSPMGYITLSLYNDIDGVITPLSRDAFAYYKFQLDASFYDQDYLVHKIKIIPRREGYDLYSGYIYIVEGFWHLHSAELKLEQKMFSIKINQVYTPVGDDIWMPVSHDFDIEAGIMGIKFAFKYVASVSNYKVKLNSKLDHSVYRNLLVESKDQANELALIEKQQQNEIHELVTKEGLTKKESRKLKKLVKEDVSKSVPKKELEIKDHNHVDDSANLRSVAYWDSIRPIPLTADEFVGYKVKDSIQFRAETDTSFRDSLKRDDSKFKWNKLLMGGTFSFDKGHSFNYGGLLDFGHIDFNTVDGLKYGMEFSYSHRSDSGKYFRINQKADYAFARERMTSYIDVLYRYNGMKRAYIYLNGGRRTSDFDSHTGITKNLNAITTLFLKENYLKLYQKDYISIGHKVDIAHGLDLFAGFEYAKRQELVNHSDFNLYNPFKNDYTSNIPPVENIDNNLVKNHNASILSIKASYTPEYYYRISEGVKWYSYSRYPTFGLNYNKGINKLLGSNVNFDQLEFTLNQRMNIRRLGGLQYKFVAGSFLNSKNTYFADYKHFGANTPFLIGTSEGSIFRLINYYEYSTNENYFEGHIKLENDRMILKRLPVLNKTLMREVIYFNYLSTTGSKPYYEIGYGLNQIFLMFNLEVFAGFKGSSHEYTGIKIGIPFVGKNGNSITIGG